MFCPGEKDFVFYCSAQDRFVLSALFHLVSSGFRCQPEKEDKADKADADAELTVELFRAIMKDDAQQDRQTNQRMG